MNLSYSTWMIIKLKFIVESDLLMVYPQDHDFLRQNKRWSLFSLNYLHFRIKTQLISYVS